MSIRFVIPSIQKFDLAQLGALHLIIFILFKVDSQLAIQQLSSLLGKTTVFQGFE